MPHDVVKSEGALAENIVPVQINKTSLLRQAFTSTALAATMALTGCGGGGGGSSSGNPTSPTNPSNPSLPTAPVVSCDADDDIGAASTAAAAKVAASATTSKLDAADSASGNLGANITLSPFMTTLGSGGTMFAITNNNLGLSPHAVYNFNYAPATLIKLPSSLNVINMNDNGDVLASNTNGSGYIIYNINKQTTQSFSLPPPPPNTTNFTPRGINNAAIVVGDYTDAAGNKHGFACENGAVSTLDFPWNLVVGVQGAVDKIYSVDTQAYGISSDGAIVGQYTAYYSIVGDSSGIWSGDGGFLYNNGTWVSINYPGAYGTYADAVNSSHYVVGHSSAEGGVSPPNHSFLYANGTYQCFVVSGAAYTQATGINNSGNIVGWYTTPTSGIELGAVGSVVMPDSPKANGCTKCPNGTKAYGEVGEPISVGTGNVYEEKTDYTTSGQNPLSFSRSYNSMGNASFGSTYATTMGVNWRSNYDRYLHVTFSGSTATQVQAERPNGQVFTFNVASGSTWTTDGDTDAKLTGVGTGTYVLTDADNTVETYTVDSTGKGLLNTIVARGGYTQTLSRNNVNYIDLVTDSYGRSLGFSYSGGLLKSVSTADGGTLSYSYATSGSGSVLTGVTYPDAEGLTYTYGDANNPYALTKLTDENGNDFTEWGYDSKGRATSNLLVSGGKAFSVAYNSDGTRTVTNPLGQVETYTFTMLQGVPKVSSIARTANGAVAAASMAFTYDSNGYMASKTDWNGVTTSYTNDAHGQPTTIVEGVGTKAERTTNITYHATYRVPTKIVTAGLTTDMTYDPNTGSLLTTTQTDTTSQTAPYSTNGTKRVWTNTWSNGLLSTVTDPKNNVTGYAYDGGALSSITNALGQVTRITSHTTGGLPLTVVDPNGVTTTLTYDARQRLKSSTVGTSSGSLATSYTYDNAGNLTLITYPDQSTLTMAYDAAHRLTRVTNALGEYIQYTLDNDGNRTGIDLYGTSGRVKTHSSTFDAISNLIDDIGGMDQTSVNAYDANGNRLSVTDPLSHVTQQKFDALSRLSRIIDPAGGTMHIKHDAHDHVTSFTDAECHTTTYTRNGFGDVIQEDSPDRGKTIYMVDANGNQTKKVTARGTLENRTYDALNRVKTVTYPNDTNLNVVYTYDQSGHGFGIGHLTSVTDAAGTLSRNYDERGLLTSETRKHGTVTQTTVYGYDAAGRPSTITYPSGTIVSYFRDAAGQVTDVKAQAPGSNATQTILSEIKHMPFGPITSMTYGNGIEATRTFDADYRETARTDGTAQNLATTYDNANNVKSVTDNVTSGSSQSFTYDARNWLSTAKGSYGKLEWSWDTNGNIYGQLLNSTTLTTFATAANSNQLASVTISGTTTNLTSDADGNQTGYVTSSQKVTTQTFNEAGRLATVQYSGSTLEANTYDGFGQRIYATGTDGDRLYTYGPDRTLLSQAEGKTGTVQADYIYVDGQPVAAIEPIVGSKDSKVLYFHTNYLGAPQKVTDSSKNIVWAANYTPFGGTDAGAAAIVQNLRLPGQENSDATPFEQNGFRSYIPAIGRYVQPDMLGAEAKLWLREINGYIDTDINPYAYVSNNPLKYIDPSGLYKYTPTAGDPVNETTANMLTCLDACTGRDLTVTAGKEGGHAPGSAHLTGQACDIGKKSNSGLDRKTIKQCFEMCVPEGSYGQEERDHYHLQTRPGRNGAVGFALGVK